mgnify:CR=1 FL=1
MSAINYDVLSDSEKLDLLQLLYHDLKKKQSMWTARDIEQKELIIQETQRVYNRIKMRSN